MKRTLRFDLILPQGSLLKYIYALLLWWSRLEIESVYDFELELSKIFYNYQKSFFMVYL
jgi:hypothetical protein